MGYMLSSLANLPLREELLFSIGLECQIDLDNRKLPKDLLEGFENEGILISYDFSVSKETHNKWIGADGWFISDGKETYIVKKKDDKLNVCKDSIELYILVININGDYKGGLYETIKQNFDTIAREIGPNAAIAKGFEGFGYRRLWSEPLCRKYLGKAYDAVIHLLPALLITDAHPKRLRSKSMRLFVPLRDVEQRFGNFDVFFNLLARFARDKDPEFLNRFQRIERIRERVSLGEFGQNLFGVEL